MHTCRFHLPWARLSQNPSKPSRSALFVPFPHPFSIPSRLVCFPAKRARRVSSCRWVLLLLLTISAALRGDTSSDHVVSAALRSLPWLECLAPLWMLDLLYVGVAGYVAANTVAGRFVMAPTQGLCFALLVAALAGSTVAEMLLTGDHR